MFQIIIVKNLSKIWVEEKLTVWEFKFFKVKKEPYKKVAQKKLASEIEKEDAKIKNNFVVIAILIFGKLKTSINRR